MQVRYEDYDRFVRESHHGLRKLHIMELWRRYFDASGNMIFEEQIEPRREVRAGHSPLGQIVRSGMLAAAKAIAPH